MDRASAPRAVVPAMVCQQLLRTSVPSVSPTAPPSAAAPTSEL